MKNIYIKSFIKSCINEIELLNFDMGLAFEDLNYKRVYELTQEAEAFNILKTYIERRYIDFCGELKRNNIAVETSELAHRILLEVSAYFESFYLMEKGHSEFHTNVKNFAIKYISEMIHIILDTEDILEEINK